MITLFGFTISRKDNTSNNTNNQVDPAQKTFALPQNDDGAVTIQSGSYYGTYVDLDGVVRNEIELITRYREMSMQPELETAIDEIVNEAIVMVDSGKAVEINLDNLQQPDAIKNKIRDEFKYVLKLLNFGNMSHDIFRRWYIDGRMFWHLVIEDASPGLGVQEIRYIDPRRIRKIREIQKSKDTITGMEIIKNQNEYYLYNERGVIGVHSNLGSKIAVDSIVNVNSGLMDSKRAMVLSYLHKAIKPLNQLRMIEDATVIYRLSRAPERRVFYIDVGNMPTIKAEQYLRDIMVKYRNKLVYNSDTGEIKDDRKHLCFDMNTNISLLDGRELSIYSLAKEYKEGKENWAYSCNPETGEIVPGLISWAGVTRRNERVLKLTLDNDQTIICTLDHKFPVKGKGFVEAQNLTIGESMIPLYRDKQKVHSNGNEYERVYQNNIGKWISTHRLVSNWKNINNINEDFVYDERFTNDKKTVTHHVNFDRFNNTPSKDWKKKLSKVRIERDFPSPTTKTWKITHPDGIVEIRENIAQFCREKGFYPCNIRAKGHSNGYKAERVVNHKIKNIEFLDDTMDVGTITIDGKEKYHNFHTFALSVGIFTKNSMLEDFYLPRREGSKGTEITTLPSGQNLGEMEEVKYFEKKLYKSLGVPISRLEPQQGFSLGRSTEITRDELKFNKFIHRIRNKFSTMFDDLLRVQLVLKRVCTEEEWKAFKEDIWYDYKKDNNFTELKETELLNTRLGNLQLIDPFVGRYYSEEWVRKNVLQQTDEDIEEINEQNANESQAQAQAQADAEAQANAKGMTIDQNGRTVPMQQPAMLAGPNEEQLNPDGTPVLPSKFEVQANEMEIVK